MDLFISNRLPSRARLYIQECRKAIKTTLRRSKDQVRRLRIKQQKPQQDAGTTAASTSTPASVFVDPGTYNVSVLTEAGPEEYVRTPQLRRRGSSGELTAVPRRRRQVPPKFMSMASIADQSIYTTTSTATTPSEMDVGENVIDRRDEEETSANEAMHQTYGSMADMSVLNYLHSADNAYAELMENQQRQQEEAKEEAAVASPYQDASLISVITVDPIFQQQLRDEESNAAPRKTHCPSRMNQAPSARQQPWAQPTSSKAWKRPSLSKQQRAQEQRHQQQSAQEDEFTYDTSFLSIQSMYTTDIYYNDEASLAAATRQRRTGVTDDYSVVASPELLDESMTA